MASVDEEQPVVSDPRDLMALPVAVPVMDESLEQDTLVAMQAARIDQLEQDTQRAQLELYQFKRQQQQKEFLNVDNGTLRGSRRRRVLIAGCLFLLLVVAGGGVAFWMGLVQNDKNNSSFPNSRPDLIESWELLDTIQGKHANDVLGRQIALSADGSILAAGAPADTATDRQPGHVRIFARHAQWTQLGAAIQGGGEWDRLGWAVALSADGRIVAAGAPRSRHNDNALVGHVQVFQFSDGSWEAMGQAIRGMAQKDQFGTNLALSANGKVLAASSIWHNDATGYVRVFCYEDATNQWKAMGKIVRGRTRGDLFGWSLKLSADGSVLAASARESHNAAGSVRVLAFDDDMQRWVPRGQDLVGETAGDRFGYSIALSADGSVLAAGAHLSDAMGLHQGAGQARIYHYGAETNQWSRRGQVLYGDGAGDQFGASLALTADGDIVVVGAVQNDDESGLVRVFGFSDTLKQWDQLGQTLDGGSPMDGFGRSVAVSADGTIVAGSSRANGANRGQVRVYGARTRES